MKLILNSEPASNSQERSVLLCETDRSKISRAFPSDCTDSSPLGSVLGNSIERGYGYTPSGDHFANLCGLEVILPTGEIFVTGGGSSSSKTWTTHKWGYGASVDGLFSQSNFGIIIKAGVWLMPKPEELNLFILDIVKENLAPALDELRKLALDGTVKSHVHTANAFQTLSLAIKYPEPERKLGMALSADALKKFQTELGIPDWTAIGGLYGTKQQVRAHAKEVRKRLGRFGKINFFDEKKVQQSAALVKLWTSSGGQGLKAEVAKTIKSLITDKDFSLVSILPEMYGVLVGKPTWQVLKSAYFKSELTPPETDLDPARDHCGIMWMAPAVPMLSSEIKQAENLAQELFKKHGFNMSACFTMMNQRTLFFLLGIFFDQNNSDEKARATKLYADLHHEFAVHGFQHYRGGVPDWKVRSDNEITSAEFLRQLKTAVDPNQVLAPGRYGI